MALVNFVSRSDLRWPVTSAGRSLTNLGMIAHYDAGFWLRDRRATLIRQGMHGHTACREYWQRVRNQHREQGWLDVGYAYFVCPDDYIFAGREVGHQQAAEAPTPGKRQNGNSRYVAVTFGLGPGEKPTAGAIRAWHRLRTWLMDVHGVKEAVYGHQDFTATSCPGEPIYALVKNGALRRAFTIPSKPPITEEEPMLDYASFGASDVGDTEVQPNVWTDVLFDTEYADPTNAHPDAGSHSSILKGKPTFYVLEFGASVEGAAVGDSLDIDVAEYVYDGLARPPVDELKETGKPTAATLTASFRVHHTAVGSLRKNGKLRVRVFSHAVVPVKITGARVSVAFSE